MTQKGIFHQRNQTSVCFSSHNIDIG